MNLARLEEMAASGDVSAEAALYLIQARMECEWLDYKEQLSLEHDKSLCDFAKDVLAIKNSGGGYLVIGVRDKSWETIGLGTPLSYDGKMLRDKVRKASGVEIDLVIVHHTLRLEAQPRLFAIILVRASKRRKKRRTPTVVRTPFCENQAYGLRRGEIYARQGDSTIRISSQAELEDLLDGLEAQADEDSATNAGVASPFAIEEGTYRLLEKGFETFVGRDGLRSQVLSAVTTDPRIWIINVHGPGGVGKSALVNWVTYELYRQRAFEAIIQLTAKETVLTDSGIQRFHGRSLYSLENLLDHILGTFLESENVDLEKKKHVAIDILMSYKTLLVLDNMETVSDGRILAFLQSFPVGCQSKALLTSRTKTGGWEQSIPVQELLQPELDEFIRIKSQELGVVFPIDRVTCDRIASVTGGLPLAVQWIIGRYRASQDIDNILNSLRNEASPVLEFSFRNIWESLSPDAQAILAVTTIFDSPPTVQQISIATEWPIERIERALAELTEVTLLTRNLQQSDGQTVFASLPITRSFAQYRFSAMGEFEARCRQRITKFNEQMRLQQSEVYRFTNTFEKFGLQADNERRAAILCTRGQSEMFSGNADNADLLFKQAQEMAPDSGYVLAMSASYELARNRIGRALELARAATRRATKKNGSLCYAILARVLDVQRDRPGRVEALEKALSFDGTDVITRHQYGVALSRDGRPQDAIGQFTIIIDQELRQPVPTPTLLMALKTRIINHRRLHQDVESKADLALAQEIIAKYPHLQSQARQFNELIQDD